MYLCVIGYLFEILHFGYGYLMAFNILFCEDLGLLTILLNILFLNVALVFMFRRCPLELMIQKCMDHGTCFSDEMKDYMKSLNWTDYQCDHIYENELKVLGTGYVFLVIKILTLIFHRTWKTRSF
jgi:hypothetical protein